MRTYHVELNLQSGRRAVTVDARGELAAERNAIRKLKTEGVDAGELLALSDDDVTVTPA